MIISEYIRLRLLEQSDRFTFETVLSDESKLEFMRMAKDAGFKVYLYYVALASPEMNVARVHSRVLQGGHDVPKRKIVQRYERTMSNLFEAMRIADNVYLFDNRGPSVDCSEGKRYSTIQQRVYATMVQDVCVG